MRKIDANTFYTYHRLDLQDVALQHWERANVFNTLFVPAVMELYLYGKHKEIVNYCMNDQYESVSN